MESKTQDEFLAEAKEIHKDRYIYDKVDYVNDSTKVTITCRTHGDFSQTPNKHLKGQGCPLCAPNKVLTREDFISRAREVHGNKYDYSQVGERVGKYPTIICKTHGAFTQYAHDHMNGAGCAQCYNEKITSHVFYNQKTRPEFSYQVIIEILGNEKFTVNDREILSPLEIDIYLPEHRLGIEINGLYWHSKRNANYHEEKFRAAQKKGIQLVQFWDSEVLEKPDLVASFLNNKLGKTARKLSARKCKVVYPSFLEYNEFLENNHLEGTVFSGERVGLSYDGELVSVMGFSKNIMQRFCSKRDTIIRGALGKLLVASDKTHIITYSDNRYSTGNAYKKLGFTQTGQSRHRLFVTDYKKIYNRRGFQRKNLKSLPSYAEDKTAEEILNDFGYFYIYGPGTQKWEVYLDGR